ncbi:MAG: corrinoid protein [Anaerolineae bacterium]|nr:corrinoid protein [Anaerolineae bacterium]
MSLETIYAAVLKGNAKVAVAEAQATLEAGVPAEDILQQACIPAMTEVGRLFETGEKFVPEMLIAARAMQSTVNLLKPHLIEADIKKLGKVVIGTVAGDLHDIGKNLVGMMLEGAGFEVIDLGTDVSPEAFVKAVQEHQADMVGLSALLTTTISSMKETIDALKEAGLRQQVKVMVGGAPISQDYANQIGADGYSADAGSAPRVAKSLVGVV